AQIPGGGQGLHQADAPPSAVSGGPDVSRTYRRWHLIGIPVRDMPKRAPDDLEVEPQRPLIDVVEIEFEAPLRLLHRVDLAAKAADLCKSGDSRSHPVPREILAHRF